MQCSTCRHFNSFGHPDASAEPDLGNERAGVCRRYPPRVFNPSWDELGGLSVTSAFPQVHPEQRCGEYTSTHSGIPL